ncbi:Uncharacterised protein [Corynebacterium renale]|nr:Uncharacterised protein [Corynebacterium renale]STD70264.1 Uncharacterised protein [Corynebacterium renale]
MKNTKVHVRTLLHRENRPYTPGPRGYVGTHRKGGK